MEECNHIIQLVESSFEWDTYYVVRTEDGEVTDADIQFNYCPICGQKLKEV
jgi:hypothetical protein